MKGKFIKFVLNRDVMGIALKTLYACILSYVGFWLWQIDPKLYFSVVFAVWVVLFICFEYRRNRPFFAAAFWLAFLNLTVYASVLYIRWETNVFKSYADWVCILYGAALILGLVVSLIKLPRARKPEPSAPLFRERTYDLDRIRQYLSKTDQVGVNAPWGEGKSFLIRALTNDEEVSKDYVFIQLSLLSCNVDDVQGIILNKIEQLLAENRIFSKYSRQLQRMSTKGGLLREVGEIFYTPDYSFSEALMGLTKEIEQMDKRVVIVLEDLDRIHDGATVRKLMSIMEWLSGERIKVIYQYDADNLKRVDPRLDRAYLEKYIPYTITLTEIPFSDMLRCVLEQHNEYGEVISKEDFSYLGRPVYLLYHVNRSVETFYLQLHIGGVTVRQVEHYLHEVYTILKGEPALQKENSKQVVTTFFCLKHFMPDVYDRLEVNTPILDTLLLTYKDKEYRISDAVTFLSREGAPIQDEDEFREMLGAEDNCRNLSIALLFGYDPNAAGSPGARLYETTDSDLRTAPSLEENDRKDRLIWNLMRSGQAEYTNNSLAVTWMWEDVLQKPAGLQHECYVALWDRFYRSGFAKAGSRTIFRIGVRGLTSLFEAFWAAGAREEQWLAFVDFYFRELKSVEIDVMLVDDLAHCTLRHKSVYLSVLTHFNELKVTGNMNRSKSYRTFLLRYLRALSELAYTETYEIEGIRDTGEDGVDGEKEYVVMILDRLEARLKGMRYLDRLLTLREEVEVISRFLRKNREIIQSPKPLPDPSPQISTSFSSEYQNQKEMDRLTSFMETHDLEQNLKEADDSYKKGKITAGELQMLFRKIKDDTAHDEDPVK